MKQQTAKLRDVAFPCLYNAACKKLENMHLVMLYGNKANSHHGLINNILSRYFQDLTG